MNVEIEKYINPRRTILLGGGVGTVVILTFFVWASLAELSSAIIAQGIVQTYDVKKIVKSLQGGVVKNIFVKNGDRVEKGKILLELDDTVYESGKNLSKKEYIINVVSSMRARAELNNKISFSPVQIDRGIYLSKGFDEAVEVESFLFKARLSELVSSIELLNKKIKKLDEVTDGVAEELKTYITRQELIEEELLAMQTLYDNGHTSRTKILNLKREKANIEGNIANFNSRLKQNYWEISELRENVISLKQRYKREAANTLKEAEVGKLRAYEKLKEKEFFAESQSLVAPVTGIVTNFRVSTLSAIVAAGERVMEIVPTESSHFILAKIAPQDIDQVKVGQSARVRFSSFSQKETPEVQGRLTYVAADLTYESNNDLPYYRTEIVLEKEDLNLAGLQPGMPAEVFIVIGERSPLNYFLKPLFDNIERAWKETD